MKRADWLARERRKKELRGWPDPKVLEQFQGVTVERYSYRPPDDGFAAAMSMVMLLSLRGRMHRRP